ncbi:hypothetical protein GU926_03745 [Nibribacter ruber]|uniref:Uncharacterized protein n=1 Tax=Nibribacter ruber TaxID=2698458 RepID=A0A6P1NWJ4_9BACT|nr:hypothetical protein [Nibribacter ruber]QHL86599.1 hypothetical protein GU926_03745 [Nibribacter ruber]
MAAEEPTKQDKLGNLIMSEVMMALVSTPAFAYKGAYWTAAGTHIMSLAAFNGGTWAENKETSWYAFGLLNALALHHYFVKPTSGGQVFCRNFVGLNAVALTTHLIDKTISRKKKTRG